MPTPTAIVMLIFIMIYFMFVISPDTYMHITVFTIGFVITSVILNMIRGDHFNDKD